MGASFDGQVRDVAGPTHPSGSNEALPGHASNAGDTDSSSRVESSDRVVAVVRERLRDGGIDVAQEAGWLVEAATDEVGRVDRGRLDALVGRRVGGEPLQVVVGSTGFRHVSVGCRSGVFVPRPETEVVAGVAIDAARTWPVADRRIVDLCTGTGAIALAVASEVPNAEVLAVERDPAAVDLAHANVARLAARAVPGPWQPGDHLAPDATVEVLAGDLFAPLPDGWRGQVAVLVANPPYLSTADRGSWAREVAEHEPDAALVGGRDGHEVVDAILGAAPDWLAPGGTVVVELDERRADAAVVAAGAAGLVEATLVDDLAGRPRAMLARRPRRAGRGWRSPPPPTSRSGSSG